MKTLIFTLSLLPLIAFGTTIKCEYTLIQTGDKLEIVMESWKDIPSGAHIKYFHLKKGSETLSFGGSDFKLATMKWDNLSKWYLGAMVQRDKLRFNFIHVGPGEQNGLWSILDFGSETLGIPSGRYEPYGFCRVE
ncbi:MAG: hypothetical protein EP319_15010 [Deltaproteobacteria bacterium]|nr:MAG: hypothetical protein EP319_15010 [Deltaproteobacteria bacterium]